MTATHAPGLPIVADGLLVSTSPATGEEVARVPIAGTGDVAGGGGAGQGGGRLVGRPRLWGRRTRLLQFRSILANRMPEIADLLRRECGKPVVDGVVQTAASSPHRLGGAQRAPGPGAAPGPRSTLVLECSARVAYQPLGVIGAIGPGIVLLTILAPMPSRSQNPRPHRRRRRWPG